MYPIEIGGIHMRKRFAVLPMLASVGIGAYAYYQMRRGKNQTNMGQF